MTKAVMTIDELRLFLYKELSQAMGPLNHYPWQSSWTGAVHKILQFVEGRVISNKEILDYRKDIG